GRFWLHPQSIIDKLCKKTRQILLSFVKNCVKRADRSSSVARFVLHPRAPAPPHFSISHLDVSGEPPRFHERRAFHSRAQGPPQFREARAIGGKLRRDLDKGFRCE